MTTESQIIQELFLNSKGVKNTYASWLLFKKRFLEYLEKIFMLLHSDLIALQLEEFLETNMIA
jgi:hypothetical protein